MWLDRRHDITVRVCVDSEIETHILSPSPLSQGHSHTPPPTHLTSLPNFVVIQKPTLTSLRPFWSMNLDPPPPHISPCYRLTPPPSIVIYTEIQTYHSPVRTYPHIDPLVRLPPSELIQTDVGYSAVSSICFLWKKDKVSSALILSCVSKLHVYHYLGQLLYMYTHKYICVVL